MLEEYREVLVREEHEPDLSNPGQLLKRRAIARDDTCAASERG